MKQKPYADVSVRGQLLAGAISVGKGNDDFGQKPARRRALINRFTARGILITLAMFMLIAAFSAEAPRAASRAQATGFQPELPIAAAFFYPWYPSHWTAGALSPVTNYTPSLGLYSSTDDAVIRQQLSLAEQAHLEAFISSWWGQADGTDTALQHILSVTATSGSPIRWAAYYEAEGYGDPTVSKIAADLQYLSDTAFQSPAYLRVNGRPVLFVYDSGGGQCSLVDRWLNAKQQSGVDVYLVLKVLQGYSTCPSQPDSWHEYNPIAPIYAQLPYSVTVSPGFWKFHSESVLPRNLDYFSRAVQWMARSNASWLLITTWNEWIEGTTVEPAVEYGNDYINALCRNLPGTTPCQTSAPIATPSPTPAPSPTSSPTHTPPATSTTHSPTPSPSPSPSPTPPARPSSSATPPPTPVVRPASSATLTPTAPTVSAMQGDTDCDGDVDMIDVLTVLRSTALGSPELSTTCSGPAFVGDRYPPGDVDCDGAVRTADALMILRSLAGVPDPNGSVLFGHC